MEIKNILGRIKEPPENPKKFFAIEIGYEVVKTAIWHVDDKVTQIVSYGSIEEWSKDSKESLLQSVDKSLAIASKDISEEPNEVIFGLPESWVGVDGIADTKKEYLKEITKNLELKPVGFVVTTEAVVHHLRLKEGGPPSTVLAYLTEAEVAISLVRQGELEGTHAVGRSDDLCKDVEEGLARFGNVGDIPSRIIIYDGNIDLEAAKQTLINYDWQGVRFLHFPKIEDLDPHSSITAIAVAGGTEVAKSLGLFVDNTPVTETLPGQEINQVSQPVNDNSSINQSSTADQEMLDPSEFGISDPRKNISDETKEHANFEGDNFQSVPETVIKKEVVDDNNQEDHAKDQPTAMPSKRTLPRFSLPKTLKLPKFTIPALLPLGIALLVTLGLGGVYAYWQLPKAEVIIYTKPKIVEKNITFTLNPGQEIIDVQANSIPAKRESIELEGEKESETTGSKVVGEKAKGIVNIFNLTQEARTFPAGTKLNNDKYSFTTNEPVTIASATAEISADYKTTVTPSQEAVAVTASDIGDKYNFATGTELTVANFAKSSYVAKASSDFKGGFAREIQAISKEDRDNLKKALLAELKTQGINNLSVIKSQQKGVVEVSQEEVTKETYSGEVGDEQDMIRLALKFTQPIYTYQMTDVASILQTNFQNEFPTSFSLDPAHIQVETIKATTGEGGKVAVEAKVKVGLSPNLNAEEIKNTIRGKYPEATVDYFKNLPNFSKVETNFNVNLPAKLQTFPKVAKNITITIKMDE